MNDLVTYADVNAAWDGHDIPAVTIAVASRRAQQLYKTFAVAQGLKTNGWVRPKAGGPLKRGHFLGEKSRRCWGSTEKTRNTLAAGWRRMVHDVSHVVLARYNKLALPHGPVHAEIELRMIKHVLAKGWIAPKPAKPKPDAKRQRYEATLAGLARWQAKRRRADTAIKKLTARRRYYEKALAQEATA